MIARSLSLAGVLVALVALLIESSVAIVHAAPPALTCSAAQAAISAPASGASLNGVVQIEGSASLGNQFQYYKLEFASSGPGNFTVFSGLVRQPVANGQLAVWDSASVPDGTYDIRLRVVDTTGNYCETVVSGLKVQNSTPPTPTAADTPTPVETEVTPAIAVVPTAVPMIVIPSVNDASGAPRPTPTVAPNTTRTPGPSSLLPGGLSVGSITSPLGDAFDSFMRAFLFGVLVMAGIMLVVGVVFFVRRVL